MAASVLTLSCANPEQSGSSAGLLTLSAPAASTSTTGWTVSNTVTNRHSRQTFRTEKATGTFSTLTQPNNAPQGKAVDSWRMSAVTTGQFSAGTWYSSISVIAVTGGGTADGNAFFRLWASKDPAGLLTMDEVGSDQFNRANENPIAGNWVSGEDTLGGIQIVNNVVRGVGDSVDMGAYFNAGSWTSEQYSECRINIGAGSSIGGPAVYMSGESFYAFEYQGGSGILRRALNGVYTTLQTITVTSSSNSSLGLSVYSRQGQNVLRVWLDRVQVGSDSTDTRIRWDSNRSGGLWVQGGAHSDFTIDNWAGGTPTMFELTKNAMQGTTVTNVSTTVAQSSSASTQIATSNLTDHFLFQQVAWQRTGAGGATNNDILIRIGPLARSSGNLIGSGIETPLFTTPAAGGGGATGTPYYYSLMADWFNR